MTDWLTNEVSGSAITYLVVFAAAGLDVFFPVVPSETIVIAASVLAAQGELLIFLIVPAAALGAFVGDNGAYWLGRWVGDPLANRLFRGAKGRARLEWAEAAIQRRGTALIILGRFIPGGRTATTVAAGTLEMEYRRFLPADAVAAILWALYVSMLGFIGGAAFEDNVWLPLLIALGFAFAVTLGVEAWRRYQARQGLDVLGDELEEDPEQA
ncbi:MAG TPA: DedA family protein [Solirubrobacterales bacterium]|nr:DedA family protein [Solirubrobacterales bacterium]